jgi:hypothetical protein
MNTDQSRECLEAGCIQCDVLLGDITFNSDLDPGIEKVKTLYINNRQDSLPKDSQSPNASNRYVD